MSSLVLEPNNGALGGWPSIHNIRLKSCTLYNLYFVAWQPKFQSLVSFDAGDQGGYKVARVGRPATENIVV